MDAAQWLDDLDISQLKIVFCKRFDQNSTVWNLERHSHAYLELLFFLRGEAKIEAGHRVLSPGSYDMVAYLPGHEHQETVDLGRHQEIVCVWVDAGQSPPVQEGSFRVRDRERTLEWLFQQLEKEYRGSSACSKRLTRCYLEAIVQTAVRYLLHAGSESETASIDRVRAYIGEHFAKPLTVELLAELCHVSPSYLHRIFRRQLGVSPIQYVNQLRVREAAYLLGAGDMPIVEIAERCGFGDPRYFSRVFRKQMGVTPSQYRGGVSLP